jgi:hypothetical protein
MRVIEHVGEFDPGDPYDAMCESFRTQVAGMASDALKAAIYRDMTPGQQLSTFMAGTLTGLIGVCFASIRDEGRDAIMEGIVEALPLARRQAAEILDAACGPSSPQDTTE